jgi:hypothetical protein
MLELGFHLSRGIMPPSIITMLLESRGYLEDEGWYQTAQLMKLAAMEIEALDARIAELEAHLRSLDEASEAVEVPEPSQSKCGPRGRDILAALIFGNRARGTAPR